MAPKRAGAAETIAVTPPQPGFRLEVRPPGSKSLTNRALLLAALARGRSRLSGCLDAEDTRLMRTCLQALGTSIQGQGPLLEVAGTGGRLGATQPGPELDVGTAGTVARFLTAVLAGGPSEVHMDGSARMRERPMAELLTALRQQGAHLRCLGHEGHLPLVIGPTPEGLAGGTVPMGRPASSQFVSALVLAGLSARRPLRLVLQAGTPARPYVDMTLRLIEQFGGQACWAGPSTLHVQPGVLQGIDYEVEPDASSASYLLAAAAIHGGETLILNLGRSSLQGDAGFVEVLERMGAEVERSADSTRVRGRGVLRGGVFDLRDMPDMTLTLAVTALHARGPTTVRGVEILRHHESDRLAAAATELRKLGARVDILDDGLVIDPPAGPIAEGAEIHTYRDHRMAMAFSLAGRVHIEDPGCVSKTYPAYFTTLARIGMVRDSR